MIKERQCIGARNVRKQQSMSIKERSIRVLFKKTKMAKRTLQAANIWTVFYKNIMILTVKMLSVEAKLRQGSSIRMCLRRIMVSIPRKFSFWTISS